MAEVTGPISTLPGTGRTPPENQDCDHHPTRPAVRRVQGETDSMGCEMYDLCQECFDEFREGQKEARVGECDWCEQEAEDLRAARDYEEGMSGPVYYVCGACIRRRNDEAREELSSYDYDDDWGDDYADEQSFLEDCSPSIPAPQVGSGITITDSKGRQHVDSIRCWCMPTRSHTETSRCIVLVHKCSANIEAGNRYRNRE